MWGFWDPHYTWYVLIPTLALGLAAQGLVMAAYARAKRIRTSRGLTGAQVAQAMLQREGIGAEIVDAGEDREDEGGRGASAPRRRESGPVRIQAVGGMLSDHYDPSTRCLRLSPDVYGAPSVASAAIAAHEAGHALQHRDGYMPLALRTGIVPLVSIGQLVAPIAVMIGLTAFGGGPKGTMFQIGVLGYALMVVFSLVTLPVEFNASRRAYAALTSRGLVTAEEASVVRQVLIAAALTYVAAAVSQILHLLYILSLANRSRN